MINPIVLKTLFKNLDDTISQFHNETYALQQGGVINIREVVQNSDRLFSYMNNAGPTINQEVFKSLFTSLKISIAEFYAEYSRLDTDGVINFLDILQECDMLAGYLAKTIVQ